MVTLTDRGLWALDAPDSLSPAAAGRSGEGVQTPPAEHTDRPWWAPFPFADGLWHPVRPLALLRKRRNEPGCESCGGAPAFWVVFAHDHPDRPGLWTAVYQVCHDCRPPEDLTRDWKPWAVPGEEPW